MAPLFGINLRVFAGFAFIAILAIAPTPAIAQEQPWDGGRWHVRKTDEGCLYYRASSASSGEEQEERSTWYFSINWQGSCTPGQLINGTGTLVEVQNLAVVAGEPGRSVVSRSGTMVNGLWNGTVTQDEVYNGHKAYNTVSHNYVSGCSTGDSSRQCVPPKLRSMQQVGGAAPLPVSPQPTPISAANGKTLDTVASGLMTILGANGAANFSSGDAMIDAIVKSVTNSLTSGGGVGNDPALLNNVLSAVRGALVGNSGSTSTGQLVDLVMGVVKNSLASAKPALAAGPLTIAPPASVTPSSGGFASDASSIFAAFGRMGQSVIWDTATASGPVIKQANNQYLGYLYGCANGGVCTGMQLLACYDYPYASMGKANEWNRTKLQGRVFINASSKLCIDQYVDFSGGALDDQRLKAIFDLYYGTLGSAPTQFNSP